MLIYYIYTVRYIHTFICFINLHIYTFIIYRLLMYVCVYIHVVLYMYTISKTTACSIVCYMLYMLSHVEYVQFLYNIHTHTYF